MSSSVVWFSSCYGWKHKKLLRSYRHLIFIKMFLSVWQPNDLQQIQGYYWHHHCIIFLICWPGVHPALRYARYLSKGECTDVWFVNEQKIQSKMELQWSFTETGFLFMSQLFCLGTMCNYVMNTKMLFITVALITWVPFLSQPSSLIG